MDARTTAGGRLGDESRARKPCTATRARRSATPATERRADQHDPHDGRSCRDGDPHDAPADLLARGDGTAAKDVDARHELGSRLLEPSAPLRQRVAWGGHAG